MVNRLPKRPNSILGSKRPALNCVKCYMWDSSGVCLRPHVVRLYNIDLPNSVFSGTVFMYADDTIVYCIGDTVDSAVTSLDRVLSELNRWCQENSLTPHSAKFEAMLLTRKPYIGPLNSLIVGEDQIEWVKHTRLLGVTIDDMLSWPKHLTDVKKEFC